MLQTGNVVLEKIVVHKVGRRHAEEDITLSKSEFILTDETLQELLTGYFLKPFKKSEDYYYFANNEGKVREYVTAIFDSPLEFYVQSANLAKYLYDKSLHPNIKGGELYVVFFQNVEIDDAMVDAIGIFKSENKDKYLKIYHQNETIRIDSEQGININKIDKGCLIFNTEVDDGYKVCVIDNTNKSGEAYYWIDDFLEVKQRDNEFFKTNKILDLCRDFSETVLVTENNVDKKDKLEFIAKSLEYFQDNESFNIQDFSKDVIQNPTVIEAFNEFKNEYEESCNIEPIESFDISKKAVKNNTKYFRSVVKLDKNFHIYIHSNPEMIERGFEEERNLRFYKLYYEYES